MNAIQNAIKDVLVYIRTNMQRDEHICADPSLYVLITLNVNLSDPEHMTIIAGALYQLYVSESRTVIKPHAHVFMRPELQDAVCTILGNDERTKKAVRYSIESIQHEQMVEKWAAEGRPIINLRS